MLNLEKIKCVAFDADNTLYKTKEVAKEGDMAALEILSKKVDKPVNDLYTEFLEVVRPIKDSPDPKIRHRKYSYGVLCARYRVDVLEPMYEVFKKTIIEKIELVPGILDLLVKLKDKALYIITEDNREMALEKLTKLHILDKFKEVTTSDDAGIMKPSKNYYSELIGSFKPEEILVIGDNYEKDLKLAEELKMNIYLLDSPAALFALTEDLGKAQTSL